LEHAHHFLMRDQLAALGGSFSFAHPKVVIGAARHGIGEQRLRPWQM
jgi:hypothetical protein